MAHDISTGLHPTNLLANAASSYLRSAMRQPIQWNEWGEAAFQRAQRENKPILLDIGAVWCHWCHVMDRESYDSAEVANIINENFIAIKVDRDERPDVDSRYQSAVQAISGQGGWPLTAFLTPDGRPFFGGTYFPPDDHWGRPGFKRVLQGIATAFKEKHDEVLDSAESVMNALSHQELFAGRSSDVDPQTIENIIQAALKMFDPMYGGFGNAPKFPHSSAIDLAIDYAARTGNQEVRTMVSVTLQKMALGGIYDHLAGGFHRYSVDEKWIVPHFEKMSYDNSELLKNYVHAYQAFREPRFGAIAQDIIRWTDEWLSDRERGGFYASQDADHSMDDDGDYFTWTLDETRAVLSEDELRVAGEYYDIGEVGEMHHNHLKNVLHVNASIATIAQRANKSADQILDLLASAKKKMYAARLQRPTPYVDKTVYVSWNGMMISAYLQTAGALDLQQVRRFALKSLDRILAEAWDVQESKLAHVIAYSDENAPKRAVSGMLDDYAFLAVACLNAYEASSDLSYFRFAHNIVDAMIARFFDAAAGGFFDTEKDAGEQLGALISRRKPLQDSPTPAGNPMAAIACLRLHQYTNEERYRLCAEETLECFAGVADHFGIFAATYGIALRLLTSAHTQVVIMGEDEVADTLERVAQERFQLGKVVLQIGKAVGHNLPPALAETLPNLPGAGEGRSAAVICSGFACQPLIHDPEQLRKALEPRATP